MKKLALTGIIASVLWALAPGLGELLENALHFVHEGHAAHAAASGDRHEAPGPEHGCTGTMHVCSCCVSLSVLPVQVAVSATAFESQPFVACPVAPPSKTIGAPVYHPPRA